MVISVCCDGVVVCVLQGCVKTHLVKMLRSKKLDSNTNRFLLRLVLALPLLPLIPPFPAVVVDPDLLLLLLLLEEEEEEEAASAPLIVVVVVVVVDVVVARLLDSTSPSLPPIAALVFLSVFVVSIFAHWGGKECSASFALTKERTVSRVT